MGITISDGRHWLNYIVKKTFNRLNIMIYIHELSEVLIYLFVHQTNNQICECYVR